MAEGYEDFEFFSGQRRPLKSALNMRDVVDGRSFRFEVDRDDAMDFYSDEYDSDDDDSKKRDAKQFFEDDNFQLQPTDPTMIRLDEPLPPFEEFEKQMESIHESGKIKKLIVKPGCGIKVAEDSKVFINYVAFADGQDIPFDSSLGRKGTPAFFLADGGGAIPGLSIALKTMNIGEISKFLIYPELAYREVGCPPRIPPNCKVVFAVEMCRFVPKEKFADIFFKSVDERAQLPFQDIFDAGKTCKQHGNAKYEKKDYSGALRLYSRGILILEDYATANEEENKRRDDELAALCINKAQCLLRLEQPARACNACKMALRTENEKMKPKALLRFAEAKLMLESLDDATKYCQQSIKLFKQQNKDNNAPGRCYEVQKKIEDAKVQQKKAEELLYTKMLSLSPVGAPANPKNCKENGQ